MSVMETKDVKYYYTERNPVLKGVNIKLERGKMYVILGPSGCGKSTLLALLGGLDVPKDGKVLFEGKDINEIGLAMHRRKNVAFVFQTYNLIDYMTPAENVELTSKKDPLPILEQVGLTKEEAKRNVLKLSGGQQQRVAIARALGSEAPVILADEPTGNLDEDTAQEITRLLKEEAHKLNKSVLIVSHSMEVARQADVVLRLSHGLLEEVKLDEEAETVKETE
ncbi:ABC transporter ATP-binding protein [Anaerolentibacter hominis]|uniref:ABC transporter ATP-binding protein n=1 Tax=Anaerolentibacter hominis TaxID=3079009 RepID=UPI0031B7F37E